MKIYSKHFRLFMLLFLGIVTSLFFSCACIAQKNDNPFYGNWDVSPKEGAFRMDGYIVWGGSVIKGADGKYYMYASRWPSTLSMRAWVTNSEVVVAVSDRPEGPYEFKSVVLPSRGKEHWDGMMTHNPSIQYHDGKYVLYYIGVTYDFYKPVDSIPSREDYEKAWNNKRIGIAISDSPIGPFERRDEPILSPRPGNWDAAITSNPAPFIHEDGSVLLVYKSAPVPYPERNDNRTLQFGVVKADHYLGEYKRGGKDNRIKFTPVDSSVEDPYIWYDGEKYRMLAKCMNAAITGEAGAGFMASSNDGITWKTADEPSAYSKTISLSDGTRVKMKKLERPQVLVQDGKPTHVFFACHNPEDEIFNMVRPLKR
ncbi:glycoside hydrolase family protein [Confluentibacter flavum]|uniref:Sucrase n=1 Tax=Confluentibacter flavum TaxID=1909700 RepID=A0A2N3HGT3_9FLAO|nr:glycoside hydrolase family protein [Confluentibacter flavum]PKQ44171.1 hypothetical protein CSW08_13785 [Confluentibacter flavum]